MSSDGDLLLVLEAGKAMLRDAYWWRRLADPDAPWDEATAAAHIHYDQLPPPSPGPDYGAVQLGTLRPFAIMWADIAGGQRWRSDTGDHCCTLVSGTLVIQIELAVPAELASDPTALAIDINRKLGRIMRTCDDAEPGILDLSGRAGYLPIVEAKITGYIRTDAKAALELGDAVTAEIELQWGQRE